MVLDPDDKIITADETARLSAQGIVGLRLNIVGRHDTGLFDEFRWKPLLKLVDQAGWCAISGRQIQASLSQRLHSTRAEADIRHLEWLRLLSSPPVFLPLCSGFLNCLRETIIGLLMNKIELKRDIHAELQICPSSFNKNT